jgi:hypothetical protein
MMLLFRKIGEKLSTLFAIFVNVHSRLQEKFYMRKSKMLKKNIAKNALFKLEILLNRQLVKHASFSLEALFIGLT